MPLDVVPFIAVPVGMMRCIACSDSKRLIGRMWLGYNKLTHEDIMIECPKCHGTGQVERFKHIDVRTGKEIEYDRPGQTFVDLQRGEAITDQRPDQTFINLTSKDSTHG
jgi:hypothetical protein